jgi:hypothetical protein
LSLQRTKTNVNLMFPKHYFFNKKTALAKGSH